MNDKGVQNIKHPEQNSGLLIWMWSNTTMSYSLTSVSATEIVC